VEFLEALRSRRSVKQFDPNHEITDDEVRRVFEHAALTPTSFNMQNWQFVAVRDQSVKDELCAASWGQAQVREASLVIVCAGDLTSHRKADRYLRKASEKARGALEPMIGGLYEGKDDLLMQEACRTTGLVGMTIMLMAREMGYDSCPMIGFDPKKVTAIVGLDADHPPLLLLTIGKALQPAHPRMGLFDLEEFVSIDKFGQRTLTGEIDDS
jgi:nitroreductase